MCGDEDVVCGDECVVMKTVVIKRGDECVVMSVCGNECVVMKTVACDEVTHIRPSSWCPEGRRGRG